MSHKCFRCDAEIQMTGDPQQFVDHNPVHGSVDKCNDALLVDYQARLLKVVQFESARAEADRVALATAADKATVKAKADQEAAIKKEAEEAARAKHPQQPRPMFGDPIGKPLTADEQKTVALATAKAEADELARKAQAKKNQDEKDRAEAEHKKAEAQARK